MKTVWTELFSKSIHGSRISKYAFVGLGFGFNAYKDILSFDEYDGDLETVWGMTVHVFLDMKGYYPVQMICSLYRFRFRVFYRCLEIEVSGFMLMSGLY